MKKILLVLAVMLLAACNLFGPDPKAVTTQYLDNYYHGEFAKAYGLLSSKDKALKSEQEYSAGLAEGFGLFRAMADKITYTVKETKVTGDKAVATVELTIPDISGAMADVMGVALQAAFGGAKPDDKAMEKTIAEKLKGKDLPKITRVEYYDLVKEKDGWRVYMGWEHKKRIEELKAEADKLEKQKKFQEAKLRLEEVLKLSSRDEDAPKKVKELDEKQAKYKEKQAYFANIEVRGIHSGRSILGDMGVFGELKNKGDKALKEVEVTAYCLDKEGKVVSEKQYHPVLVSSYSFNNEGPLKANYSRQFGYKLEPPSDWSGKVRVEVTDLEFE